MWDECNCVVVWAFFGIAFLWAWNENWPFPVLRPLVSFPNLLAYWVQHFHSIILEWLLLIFIIKISMKHKSRERNTPPQIPTYLTIPSLKCYHRSAGVSSFPACLLGDVRGDMETLKPTLQLSEFLCVPLKDKKTCNTATISLSHQQNEHYIDCSLWNVTTVPSQSHLFMETEPLFPKTSPPFWIWGSSPIRACSTIFPISCTGV